MHVRVNFYLSLHGLLRDINDLIWFDKHYHTMSNVASNYKKPCKIVTLHAIIINVGTLITLSS